MTMDNMMDKELWQAMQERHSVHKYTDQPIEEEKLARLRDELAACNRESGLNIQLLTDDPETFSNALARYGSFRGVRNYFAMVGEKSGRLHRLVGYYGERLVLLAQTLGLNTCWAALTFSKGKCRAKIAPGEKLVCVISLGYGTEPGVPHKNKPMESLCRVDGAMPEWFRRGMEAALLAPTAINQQKFRLTLKGGEVQAEATGGFYSQVDLGIVQYHFELGAGRENFRWAESI